MSDWVTLDAMPKDIIFGTTGELEVFQNVKMILTTRKGTQPLDRDFGISFDFLDAPINTVQGKIEQDIFLQIKNYEPRAILKQIAWDNNLIAGHVAPRVAIEVRL
jgi:hypothetical protein